MKRNLKKILGGGIAALLALTLSFAALPSVAVMAAPGVPFTIELELDYSKLGNVKVGEAIPEAAYWNESDPMPVVPVQVKNAEDIKLMGFTYRWIDETYHNATGLFDEESKYMLAFIISVNKEIDPDGIQLSGVDGAIVVQAENSYREGTGQFDGADIAIVIPLGTVAEIQNKQNSKPAEPEPAPTTTPTPAPAPAAVPVKSAKTGENSFPYAGLALLMASLGVFMVSKKRIDA